MILRRFMMTMDSCAITYLSRDGPVRTQLLRVRGSPEWYDPAVLTRTFWGLLLLLSCGLLVDFFSFPLERPLFGALSILVAVVTLIAPSVGLALLLLGTLGTLQIPILLHLPYFSGPEPLLLAFLAAVGIRNLCRPVDLGLPTMLKGLLVLQVGAILGSCLLIWLSLWQLPDSWPLLLTADGLAKIFFWRWGNPLNFFRMGLLFLEGIGMFFAARAVYRQAPERTVRWFVGTLLVLGGLLMAYSAVDLLFRGKHITLYPGFGPVFADRNAYAAFWVFVTPIAWALALRSRGLIRFVAIVYALSAWACCILSLSVTGNGAVLVANLFVLVALRRFGPFRWPKRRIQIGILGALGLAVVFVFSSGLGSELGKARLQRRFESRITFWVPALVMISERPLLGFGPGEFYRLLPEYRTKAGVLAEPYFRQENTHNYYLQLGAETGLLGSLSFCGLAVFVVMSGFRDIRRAPSSMSTTRRQPSSSGLRGLADGLITSLGEPGMKVGLLAAVVGTLLACLGQHPLLRLVLSIYFWIAAALVVEHVVRERSRGTVTLGAPALIILSAAVLQFSLAAPVDRNPFEYGLRTYQGKGEQRYRQTEAVAFLRKPTDDARTRLMLRNWTAVGGQRVRFYRNGRWETLTLEGSRWVGVALDKDKGGALEVGVVVPDPIPVDFNDSWGGGILIRDPVSEPEQGGVPGESRRATIRLAPPESAAR